MGVLIVTNAASGRGRAKKFGAAISGALAAGGEPPIVRDARECTGASLAGFDAVIVVGGDGTLHHLLPALAASGSPVYHVPAGTENLFAREFGMTSEPDLLRAALRAGRTRAVDLARAGERRFALMLSVGPDAGVIHRLHALRGGAAGHLMYLRPILQELCRPHLPPVSIAVDGADIVRGRRGVAVVANCRQYARRLNPARDADMGDGGLDVVFLPARSSAEVVRWAARCAMGDQLGDPGVVFARGAQIEIGSEEPAPWQCDGEVGGWLDPGWALRIAVEPGTLRVLLP